MSNPENLRQRIGIYIEIPGLKMTPIAALLVAGFLKEPIRQALDTESLLFPAPLSSAIQDAILDASSAFDALLEGFANYIDIAKVARPAVNNCFRGMLQNSGIQIYARFNWFFILIDVADLERGLLIIQTELKRLALLEYSEIAFFVPGIAPDADRFRTIYPPNCIKPFERHWSLVRQLIAYSLNVLKRETAL